MSPYCHEVRGSMELTELVSYLDGYLRVAEGPDAHNAINGLQVANAGTVSRLAAAVDLCEATVRMAAEQVFFFNDTATTEIYTLSLHDALPICRPQCLQRSCCRISACIM